MQPTHPIIAELVELDTLKTWSLIVTLFGDLDGIELSGGQIKALLGHIGIKPEAIRVALHRLKTDGWITSKRAGREAVYQMSETARAETNAVAPYIYKQPQDPEETWHLLLFKDGPPDSQAILINKNLALVRGVPAASDVETLALAPLNGHIPIWVQETLVPARLLELSRILTLHVAAYSSFDDPLDDVTFRLLALHHWRRIALRPGSQAHAALLRDGPISRCHREISSFLAMSDRVSDKLAV